MGFHSHQLRILYGGGDGGPQKGRPGRPHPRIFPFVHGRLTRGKFQVTGGQLKASRWSDRASSMDQPVVCHSPFLQSLRCKGKEGIRGEHAPPPPRGEQQSKPQGRPWLVSLELARLGPVGHPCAPKMPSTGGSCPSTQGHLLERAALVLFRLTLSPQPAPPPPLWGHHRGWHSVLPVRWLPALSR